MSAVDALLDRLPRAALILGKGGVGKTTTAAALALRASRRQGALVLSTDPAKALPSVLGQTVGGQASPVSYAPALSARILDAGALRADFLARWSAVLRAILDRGTYLDEGDIGPLVDTALPGGDEIFSALELARLFAERRESRAANRLFIDTAPTGHTIRLLQLPQTFQALVRLLDAMQEKHRFMVRTLARAYRADDADRFIAEMRGLVTALEETLRDASRCAAILVANDQPLVVEETRRYLASLREMGVAVAAVIWNGAEEPLPIEQLDVGAHFMVPRLDAWPVGEKGLQSWVEHLSAVDGHARTKRSAQRAAKRPRGEPGDDAPADVASLISTLTIVAGKGGVGKTTVAAALALAAAEGHRTLLVSTDPAPSIADALDQEVPDADTPVAGVANLLARQMDATAAFDRMRSEYSARVDALFDGLVGRGVDLSQDRAIVRDLLRLAPPGVDEVYALTLIADALFENRYERVVVDPAPTGHLLRLLEMPQLALSWTHQLMRLMLKYKDVTGLGDSARELLDLSQRLRALDALLMDAARSALVLVTLDEPVVQAETVRLAGEVQRRGMRIAGVVRNRASAATTDASLPVAGAAMHLEAPATDPAPVGIDGIRRWTERWRPAHEPRTSHTDD